MGASGVLIVALTCALLVALAALHRKGGRERELHEQLEEQALHIEQLRRERRELLANVSHDLRTPLASMQGYLELLLLRQGHLEEAEQRNYLQTAARQSERLGRLVGELFDLTELDAGTMRARCEDFELAELAQDVLHRFGVDAERRHVRLAAAPASAPLRVCADIALTERVLANLLDNALRHTPAGGAVTIEVGCDASRARLAVCDTGEGIGADELPRLFERYYSAERVAGPRSSGQAGLGLAIAQRIVRLHGGELGVTSTPGAGTRVYFDLPLADRPRLDA